MGESAITFGCFASGYEEFVSTRIGFFPSIERTLLQILDVYRFYLAGLNSDLDAQYQMLPEDMSLAQITRLQAAFDDQLIAFCERLDQPCITTTCSRCKAHGVVMEHIDRL